MLNAKRFDKRITIGGVPSVEDLEQLVLCGYTTVVDVRDEGERFGGRVARCAKALGLRYVSHPIARDAIETSAVLSFYRTVFEPGGEPLYVFSRYGKKPLAFLLLLDAVARGDAVQRIYRRASQFGISLDGDLCLQQFLVGVLNGGDVREIYDAVCALCPDRLEPTVAAEPPDREADAIDSIGAALARALEQWESSHRPAQLRASLVRLLVSLG